MLNVFVVQVAINGVQVAIAREIAKEAIRRGEQYRQAILLAKADFAVADALLKVAAEGRAEQKEAAIARAKEIADIAERRIREAVPLSGLVELPLELLRKIREVAITAARELPRAVFSYSLIWGAGAALGAYAIWKMFLRK